MEIATNTATKKRAGKSGKRKGNKKSGDKILNDGRLIIHNYAKHFAENCEEAVVGWWKIHADLTPPDNVAASHPGFVKSFQKLEEIIRGQNTNEMLRRLAYVKLMRLSRSLVAAARFERLNGSARTPSRVDSTVAVELHKSIQPSNLTAEAKANNVRERRRTGRRWEMLAGPSPLFLLVYSPYAETIVHRSSGVDQRTMEIIGNHISDSVAPSVVRASIQLAGIVEAAARSQNGSEEEIRAAARQVISELLVTP